MTPLIRNILAVLAGLVLGSFANMALVVLGPNLIPPPAGADITTMEGLERSMALMQPRHFIFPFLGHAAGTLVGAWIAAKLAASRQMILAMTVAAFFLAGGIANVIMLPSPIGFSITDLALAYIPMGYLGGKLGGK